VDLDRGDPDLPRFRRTKPQQPWVPKAANQTLVQYNRSPSTRVSRARVAMTPPPTPDPPPAPTGLPAEGPARPESPGADPAPQPVRSDDRPLVPIWRPSERQCNGRAAHGLHNRSNGYVIMTNGFVLAWRYYVPEPA
jgi:hypothetical protein